MGDFIKKNQKKDPFKIKLLFLMLIFTLFGLLPVILALFYNQIIKGHEWKEKGERQYRSEYTIKSKRGRIVTNDGEILAYDGENYYITLDPSLIEEKNIEKLLKIFKENIPSFDEQKLKKEILEKKKQGKKYLKIENTIDYDMKKKILDIISQNIEIKAGVFFETNFVRNYIKNNAFQETLGYLDNENKGVYGIEKFYNQNLSGIDGLIEGFRSPRNFLSIASIKETKEAIAVRDGYNAVLTIDSVLQYALDDEMKKTYEQYSAESTMGILMEVETGKILAMSSYPKGKNNAEVKNRPITDLFEPGSIFKPITIAMGLEEGVINENSTIQSSGYIRVADRTIKDHDGSTTGSLTLEKLIALSGNVGMVKIAQMIKNEQFYKYLSDVGLGAKTGIDTYSETTQKLFSLKDMSEVKKSNISFGQGIAMTQIQMLIALNTVINDGKLVKPYLVDRLEDNEGNIIKKYETTVVKNVFSSETSRINRKLMGAVVEKGTGKGAQIPGYKIGGKTGTAQKSGARGYEKGKYFSSFFAFFPVDKPKYVVLVTVNEPKGAYYGAAVALPPVKEVLQKLIKYKGINPQGIIEEKKEQETVKTVTIKKDINKLKEEFNSGIIPDLTGISLREVLAIIPQSKYTNSKIIGNGRVVSQSPQPGVKLKKETEIKVILE